MGGCSDCGCGCGCSCSGLTCCWLSPGAAGPRALFREQKGRCKRMAEREPKMRGQ